MLELAADFADDQAVGMGGEQELHDPQPRLSPHRREHVGILCDVLGARSFHISIIIEIWNMSTAGGWLTRV